MGSEYLTQNKFAEAENIFARALAVNPKSFSGTYGRGAAQYGLRKIADAAQTLEAAIVINPTSAISYFLLGRVRRELKEYQKSEANFKKANELTAGQVAEIHWELALLYYHNLRRYAEAADELELYLKTSPKTENREQINKLIKEFREKAKSSN